MREKRRSRWTRCDAQASDKVVGQGPKRSTNQRTKEKDGEDLYEVHLTGIDEEELNDDWPERACKIERQTTWIH